MKKHLLILLLVSFALPGHSQWALDSLATGRMNLQAVTFGDKVYFIGGETGQYPINETGEVAIYDCNTSTWSPSDSLSLARCSSVCISGDSGIYVVGGRIQNYNLVYYQIPHYDASNRIDIFKNGAWHTDSLPGRVWGGRALKVGSKLIFAGFVDSVNYLLSEIYASKKVYIYDESTGLWKTDSLSSARTELGAATDGTLAIFAGGVNGLGITSDVVDIYNSTTDSWSTAHLSVSRGYVGGAYANGKFYFAGGMLMGAFNFSTDVIDIYDGSAWTTGHLSIPRAGVMAIPVNNDIYFMGGAQFDLSFLPFPNANGSYGTVDVLNIFSGNWSRQDFNHTQYTWYFNVPYWHLYGGFTTWRNKIFVGGGGILGFSQGNISNAFSPYVEILDAPVGLTNTNEPVFLDVFPNPSSGTFAIVLPEAKADISVIDAYGREVLKSKATNKIAELRLDKSGVYLVKVLTSHGTAIRKVVIDK